MFLFMGIINIMQVFYVHYLCDGSTGAVATDFDGDGRLELLVSHGESAAQPLSVYRVSQVSFWEIFSKAV